MELSPAMALEALGWMALSFVKFVVTPTAAVAAGVSPWKVFVYSASGAGLGLVMMRPASQALFQWRSQRRRIKGKLTFTAGRRRLVRIKQRFGLWGIAVIGGVIGVPIAGLVAFKYFGHRRAALPVLVLVFSMWSALLTAIASFALI
jgi:hypothetical protein